MELCRLCAFEAVNTISIFDVALARYKILKTLKINIQESDTLPKCICLMCLAKLERFYKTIDDCVESQVTLRRKLQVNETGSDEDTSLSSTDNNVEESSISDREPITDAPPATPSADISSAISLSSCSTPSANISSAISLSSCSDSSPSRNLSQKRAFIDNNTDEGEISDNYDEDPNYVAHETGGRSMKTYKTRFRTKLINERQIFPNDQESECYDIDVDPNYDLTRRNLCTFNRNAYKSKKYKKR